MNSSKVISTPPSGAFRYQPKGGTRPLCGFLTLLLAACSPTGPDAATKHRCQPTATAILPDFLPDPIEPVNRGIWNVNFSLLKNVIHPVGRAYRSVVAKPVRESIAHFGRNATYPGRVINETLQGRWRDSGDESLRFLTNTTVGVAGFFDVASRWNIPKPNASFGQSLQKWGWKPGTYVMIPLLGPSDDCNFVGTTLDEAADPWNYIGTGDHSESFRYVSSGIGFNRLADSSGEILRSLLAESDSYSVGKIAWSYAGRHDSPDWKRTQPIHLPTLQTLAVASIRLDAPDFVARGREMSALIPGTGRKLPYNVWKQSSPAPLVYVNPGLGSHRMSPSTLTVAEGLFQSGFSVVVTSSVFHPEFMKSAATTEIPGLPPADCADLLAALTAIDQDLVRKHPGDFTSRALVGCSLGGYQSLILAANQRSASPSMLRFDRFVAINPPVDLHYGVKSIDAFFNSPSAWPAAERQARVNNSVHKVGAFSMLPASSLPATPFDAEESKYLIGLTFRYVLRDAIFSSQSRHNLGVLQQPLSSWKRETCYNEILGFSYADYVRCFLVPYYASKGVSPEQFKQYGTLKNFTNHLRGQKNARIITNRNDFLLASGDISWMQSTLGADRCKLFAEGGHLGNLATPEVHHATAAFLTDLKK